MDDPFVRQTGEHGLDLLYNMHLAEADAAFNRIETRYPEHPIGPFLHSLIIWWQILPDLQDESHDKDFYAAMKEVIKRSNGLLKKDKNDFDAMFFKGAALGFRGRLRSNRGKWFKAAKDGKEALDYIFRISAHDTTNADYQFGQGVYDYFAEMTPKKYPVAKPVMLFFPKGNRERGLRELERTATEGHFIRTEATYFLLQIFLLYEPDYAKSLMYVRRLRAWYPDNPFFHALEGRVYARWGRWEESTPVYAMFLERYYAGEVGYSASLAEQALYYLGRGEMAGRRYETAARYFLQLDSLSALGKDDTYFRVLGTLRLGMTEDALGRRPAAVDHYRAVLKMKDFAGAHELARRYRKTPYRG